MNRKEDIVYYDFQGWPEYKMNLREILIALGGKVEGDTISFDLNDPCWTSTPEFSWMTAWDMAWMKTSSYP